MDSYLLRDESDIRLIRDLIARLPAAPGSVDLDEALQLAAVRASTRLWLRQGRLVAYALVDAYSNLRFEVEESSRSDELAAEIVDWGVACLRRRNAESGEENTLDACFDPRDTWQIALLECAGFQRQNMSTLRYARSLRLPIAAHPLPEGFALRRVRGAGEVESLVALHRAAFGTDHMTVEERLAMMRTPQYLPELDLVAVAPEGDLAAFCVCGVEGDTGYTDPIGTHPSYQRRGLGKAMVTAGLRALSERGVQVVELGTSSDNTAMQWLAQALGFEVVSEQLWFSKRI